MRNDYFCWFLVKGDNAFHLTNHGCSLPCYVKLKQDRFRLVSFLILLFIKLFCSIIFFSFREVVEILLKLLSLVMFFSYFSSDLLNLPPKKSETKLSYAIGIRNLVIPYDMGIP